MAFYFEGDADSIPNIHEAGVFLSSGNHEFRPLIGKRFEERK